MDALSPWTVLGWIAVGVVGLCIAVPIGLCIVAAIALKKDSKHAVKNAEAAKKDIPPYV